MGRFIGLYKTLLVPSGWWHGWSELLISCFLGRVRVGHGGSVHYNVQKVLMLVEEKCLCWYTCFIFVATAKPHHASLQNDQSKLNKVVGQCSCVQIWDWHDLSKAPGAVLFFMGFFFEYPLWLQHSIHALWTENPWSRLSTPECNHPPQLSIRCLLVYFGETDTLNSFLWDNPEEKDGYEGTWISPEFF